MNGEQREVLLKVLQTIDYIDDSDSGQSSYRCAKRMIAEVLGLPLEEYMLLMDKKETLKPLYCKSQYE